MTTAQRVAFQQCKQHGEFIKPEGVRWSTMRALVSQGLIAVKSCETKSYSKIISPIFGRVRQCKDYRYLEVRYVMTDAGRMSY
jgi:hypothetical protein